MTIESQLAQLQQAATEQTEASVQLANNITEGLQEIDQVKQDIAHTYQTVNQNNQALNDWQTQSGSVNLKDLNGNSHTLPTLKSLIADAQSVNPHPHVMTKAQFDALREMRKQQYAGSGFVEWGLGDSAENAVNNGMWVYQNKLNLGRSGKTRGWFGSDKSSTPFPKGLVDGVSIDLQSVDYPYGIVSCKFPPAPDGTKTYDSASGTVTQHNDAETAFAAETDSNKVITSRKDLVFLESWHEKIAEKDVVYPLGNVQYGANSYKGITLRNNLVAQGYSAFGEWDADTKGHGIKWSSLTESQKAIFLGEPEHNIYYDPKAKAYIQVRYRIRVIEGLGNDWRAIRTNVEGVLCYDVHHRIGKQGIKAVTNSYVPHSTSNGFFSSKSAYSLIKSDLGVFHAVEGINNNKFGHNGLCYALPIALVQRLNQGAYHPSYNPMGTTQYTMTGVRNYHWYELPTSLRMSTLGCFIQPTETSIGKHPGMGYIGSHGHSRADQYKYHDAIYAGQVEDLRLSAKKQDVNALREETMRKAVAGTLRGKEKIPFTYFEHRYGVELARPATYNPTNAGGSIEFKISAGQPVLDAYLSDPNNIGYYVYNQKGGSIYISKLIASPINYVHWPYSGNDKVTCYIYGVENKVEEFNATFSIGDKLFIGVLRQLSSEFDTLPSVDIIGSPENIAATFPDGVVGQWTPKLPTGVIERFAANRKATGGQYGIFTLDNGASWRTTISTFNSVSNDFTNDCEANRVQLMYYESSSKFTEQVQNSHILGLLDKSYFSADYALSRGNRLMGSLIDKAGKSDQNSKRYGYVATESLAINNNELLISNGYSPTHKNLSIGSPRNNSAAFKVMPSITSKNGLLYLQFHGAELKHNGTDWGDDQTIPIIDRENTKTDLNGNTVKVFCHHTLFPIGIAHNG